jgi:Uma2 family endonuclease
MAAHPEEMLPLEQIRPLRRVEYDQLVDAGAFGDERVELLYGRLIQMSPQGTHHSYAIRRLNKLLVEATSGRAHVQVQLPLAVSDVSEPEPDISVVPLGDYLDHHPKRAMLVIEVSDTSVDRSLKARLYAEAGVTEYWIVNLIDQVVEVHRSASGGAYSLVTKRCRGEVLELIEFPDVRIPVSDCLPHP